MERKRSTSLLPAGCVRSSSAVGSECKAQGEQADTMLVIVSEADCKYLSCVGRR